MMQKLIAKRMFIFSLLALILQLNYSVGKGRKFTIVNNCSYTVWPAFVPSTSPPSNFSLQNQEKMIVDIQTNQSGSRLWGRTGCDNSTGKFTCKTGDCGSGTVDCAGRYAKGATTLVEFTLNGYLSSDFFDTSLVGGYNIPVSMAPQGGTGSGCGVTGCIFNVSGACPSELLDGDGGTCQDPCTVFNQPQYCCTNTAQCNATSYSMNFKRYCPRAYSYPEDDDTSMFACKGFPSYTVTFCPTSTAIFSELSKPFGFGQSASPVPRPATTYKRRPSSPTPSPELSPIPVPPSLLLSPQLSRNSTKTNKKARLSIDEVVAPTTIGILILLFLGIWFFLKKRTHRERDYGEMEEISNVESFQFDINTIKAATCNFSMANKLGEGGFGEVYKGTLESGQEVAVKRLLQNSKQGAAEFKTEVVLVAKLQHKNLVKLLGFCGTSKEKILVYEFLPNSSLDRFLFDSSGNTCLDWRTRLNIIIGIARGLMYLHEDSRLKVIHRDLKTSNILLDEAMTPKISDFGLAKLFKDDQTQGDTKRIVGTYGYMAPEYAITGHYSIKSDVYSFGVIVLEIISGQKNRFYGGLQFEEALLHRAWRLWNEGKQLDLIDTKLNEDFVHEEVIRCFQIGLLCVQEDAIQRPGMRLILDALSRPSISLQKPNPPRFFGNPSNVDEDHPSLSNTYTGTQMITDVYPRH